MPETLNATFDQIKPLIIANIKAGIVPALLGMAGIGKSSFIKSIADEMNTKAYVLSMNVLADRADLTGARMVQDKEGNYKQAFFPHAKIQESIEYAQQHADKDVLLFLDEFNRTAPDVTSATFQLITEREIGTTPLPKNVRLIVAGNDTGNISSVDSASITRMAVYHVIPDLDTFLAKSGNVNPLVKEFFQQHPEDLVNDQTAAGDSDDQDEDDDDSDDITDDDLRQEFADTNAFQQLTVPRTWTHLSDMLNELKLDDSSIVGRQDLTIANKDGFCTFDLLINSTIGNTSSAAKFTDFLISKASQPTSTIVKNPFSSINADNDLTADEKLEYDRIKSLNDMQSFVENVKNEPASTTSKTKNLDRLLFYALTHHNSIPTGSTQPSDTTNLNESIVKRILNIQSNTISSFQTTIILAFQQNNKLDPQIAKKINEDSGSQDSFNELKLIMNIGHQDDGSGDNDGDLSPLNSNPF